MYFRSAPVSSVLFAPASVSVSFPSAAASEFSVTLRSGFSALFFLMVIVHYEVDPCLCQIQDFCPRSKTMPAASTATAPGHRPLPRLFLLRLLIFSVLPTFRLQSAFSCPAWQVTIKNPFLVGCADGIFTFKPVLYYGQRNKCADLLSSYHCSSFLASRFLAGGFGPRNW